MPRYLLNFCLGCLVFCAQTSADTVTVAVASNFAPPMPTLIATFEQNSGHHIKAAYGSSGKFYAQIQHGAPFQILLSADQKTAQKLAQQKLALAESQFTYATGRLVLWSADRNAIDGTGIRLQRADFKHLALADPALAPYGAAAINVLQRLHLLDKLRSRFVQGENIAKTYQFVISGNAELGFVALSQVWRDGKISAGSAWIVPVDLHAPLHQDAIILLPGKNQIAVDQFMTFLRSDNAIKIIAAFGYE